MTDISDSIEAKGSDAYLNESRQVSKNSQRQWILRKTCWTYASIVDRLSLTDASPNGQEGTC